MSEAPSPVSVDSFALRLALRLVLSEAKPHKARARLEEAAERLRSILPRELGDNVRPIRLPSSETLSLRDAAHRALAVVESELEAYPWRSAKVEARKGKRR